jgi:hypothetical protein
MNHLKLHSSQISLELPGTERKYEMDVRSRMADPEADDEGLRAARGIAKGLALAACMWLIVLATVVFF